MLWWWLIYFSKGSIFNVLNRNASRVLAEAIVMPPAHADESEECRNGGWSFEDPLLWWLKGNWFRIVNREMYVISLKGTDAACNGTVVRRKRKQKVCMLRSEKHYFIGRCNNTQVIEAHIKPIMPIILLRLCLDNKNPPWPRFDPLHLRNDTDGKI